MAERKKRIGLVIEDYGDNWTGGSYYVLNIINALNHVKPSPPALIVFYKNPNTIEHVKKLNYPGATFLPVSRPVSLPRRIINKLIRVFKKNYNGQTPYSKDTADFIFPCVWPSYDTVKSLKHIRKIYWIPDFQHRHLPHFFSADEISFRDRNYRAIADLPVTVVLSSEDAKKDFVNFYPGQKANLKVVPFASVLPPYAHIDIDALKEKYHIRGAYFISPNQFWAHKNHTVILKAASVLKSSKREFKIVFTGKEYDYRSPGYTDTLKQFVKDNELEEYVSFLGFIDRAEQLQLMKHALAVVQPSLFEGWSTVVEDAKALNQSLILSDIKVHREQCGDNATYFDPKNERQLAEHLLNYLSEKKAFKNETYEKYINDFANRIVNL